MSPPETAHLEDWHQVKGRDEMTHMALAILFWYFFVSDILGFPACIYSGSCFMSSLWLPFLLRVGRLRPAACSQGPWLRRNWNEFLSCSALRTLNRLVCTVRLQNVLKNVAFSSCVCSRSSACTPPSKSPQHLLGLVSHGTHWWQCEFRKSLLS